MGATGLEPVTPSTEGPLAESLATTPPIPLAQALARESQIDPTLARIVDAWPKLPEAIRRAMLALVESGST